ncbi:ethanolamine utilization protein [Paraburkholderia steynii]|uniref:Ethanolamine utilization protein n=1 Tax=Paraburkholderia steynii TaxID=1245441 RepID=A0A4R0XDM8_9BURK|nr:ethanolamine utilization protein [Paraburkholderia steynii]
MHALAVDVRFDSAFLFLDLADGRAFEFPLDWFPLLQAATGVGRTYFAISLDGDQVFWPELDEDMNVTALLASFPDRLGQ